MSTPQNNPARTAEIARIRTDMCNVVLETAKADGPVVMVEGYADSFWRVTVNADGTTIYGGYAEEQRGPTGTIAQLTMWELGHMLDNI